MAMTDLDATNYELEQKAIASSMESYYRQEHDRKQKASGPAGAAASGRRRRGSPPPPAPPDEQYNSMFASAPSVAASAAGGAVSDPSVASLPPASAASRSSPNFSFSNLPATDEEYPQTVQELVMNGFELEKVVRAYELFGDHFDDLFAYLLASSSSSS